MIPHRECLRLLGRCRSGSAFPADVVAQRRLEGLVEEVPLVNAALLPLHIHRMVQAAPWLSNSALHPMVWVTMASADFSPLVRGCSQPPAPIVRRGKEISQGKTLLLPSNPPDLPCVASD